MSVPVLMHVCEFWHCPKLLDGAQRSTGGQKSCVCGVPQLWPSSCVNTMMSQFAPALFVSGVGKLPDMFASTA
jgi:hypothetical protein